jgi:hypothetical protein
MAFEKGVLGSVLGSKEGGGAGDARKFHNEKLPIDHTKGIAENL